MTQSPDLFDKLLSPAALMCVVLLIAACAPAPYARLQGQTMGTYYAVTMESTCAVTTEQVDQLMAQLNASFSTWDPESRLSQINLQPPLTELEIDEHLSRVLQAADEVWQLSGGAFDVTIGPLVNLWGFGPDEGSASAPSEAAAQAARASTGMRHLSLSSNSLSKAQPQMYIDMSALAKGYAVDRLALLLQQAQCQNFMADIGGEIKVVGQSPAGRAWRIGVEAPVAEEVGQHVAVLELSGRAVATSGDYRNYREIDGVRVDHVIDPRIGAPVTNAVVSATVVHDEAMIADAWATTMMVLGEDSAMALADEMNLPLLLLLRVPQGAGSEGSTAAGLQTSSTPSKPWKMRYNGAMEAHVLGQRAESS